MPWLHLSRGPLEHVLQFLPDASVLGLAATCRATKNAVEECRAMHLDGPRQHPPGPWEPGLWRFLGLGDLKMIPRVTLCCEAEFKSVAEARVFLKAAKDFAALTADGRVYFAKFSFAMTDVAYLLNPCGVDDDDSDADREAEQKVEVEYKGLRMQCTLVATRTWSDVTKPRMLCLEVTQRRQDRRRKKPVVIGRCNLTPDLRLESSHESLEVYADLWRESPLAELMHKGLPLPLFLGVRR
eukprot:Skav227712  [mRNA]  locus=scaffold79:159703:160710:+ [translate_table: standard]